jgi:transcriptional regulator with XRE-family HTH domain
MNVIDKIVEFARRQGMTQGGLERAAGLSANRISKWKDGKGRPTLAQAARIAKQLELPIAFLADDAQDEPLPSAELERDEQAAMALYRELRAEMGAGPALHLLAKVAAVTTRTPDNVAGLLPAEVLRRQQLPPPCGPSKVDPPCEKKGPKGKDVPPRHP